MNSPLVSIIVPVYNVEHYLHKCLDSIQAQTFTDFEAVLVDDGSTDGSGRICDEYAAKDSRFVVVHKQNEGVAKARITAFEHSKGELITFIDADDYVSMEYVERLAKPILEDSADMVSCDIYIVKGDEIIKKKAKLSGVFYGEQLKHFIANNYFIEKSINGFGMTNFLCTKMVKREFVLEALEKGEGLWYGEDQIGVFSLLYRIKTLYLLSDRLYYYVHYEGQTTKKYNRSLWDALISMFEKYREIDTENLAVKQLRNKKWYYINRTIRKMTLANIEEKAFVEHLSQVRERPVINDFFRPMILGIGWKNELKYMLMKMRLFKQVYFVFKFMNSKR